MISPIQITYVCPKCESEIKEEVTNPIKKTVKASEIPEDRQHVPSFTDEEYKRDLVVRLFCPKKDCNYSRSIKKGNIVQLGIVQPPLSKVSPLLMPGMSQTPPIVSEKDQLAAIKHLEKLFKQSGIKT
jgi:hypothetical protein